MSRRNNFVQINPLRLRYVLIIILSATITDWPAVTRLINLRRDILVIEWKAKLVGCSRIE